MILINFAFSFVSVLISLIFCFRMPSSDYHRFRKEKRNSRNDVSGKVDWSHKIDPPLKPPDFKDKVAEAFKGWTIPLGALSDETFDMVKEIVELEEVDRNAVLRPRESKQAMTLDEIISAIDRLQKD